MPQPHSFFLLLPLLACSSTGTRELAVAATSPTAPAATRNVAILIYEGVELLDFAGPGEVFSSARGPDGAGFRVFTVAKTHDPIQSQRFVRITPEFSIDDCPKPDLVIVPGGNVPDEDRELCDWVRTEAATDEMTISVCNGAFLLAAAGLLDGLEVTTHHGSLKALTNGYPKLKVLTNRRFVDSGRVMTCAGVSAGIDGALHVVERLLGEESAKRTAFYMEYDWRPAEIAAQHREPGRTLTKAAPVRLEKGSTTAVRFACPDCGRQCDEARYATGGTCPTCPMELVQVAGE